ncbi:hypothetical protein L1987_15420 [Smallanthus sonchifolius]|uniref:Uncharacterized protein n=1 Tax=Smallanthus sonchifolius TaxID=185202 RepID=A0ACB9J7M0_9ASTR|nr:hypothetical protein L1987_15420 [Smallanthus sonchifolius]
MALFKLLQGHIHGEWSHSYILAIGMAIILSSRGENYGDPSDNKDLLSQFKGAAVAIASDEKIALLRAIQSLFEGFMYTFFFLWTPTLSPNDEEIPHGFIFATFMLASMLGSSVVDRLMARSSPIVESYIHIVFLVSAASLLLPVVTNVNAFPITIMFGMCSIFLFVAAVLQRRLLVITDKSMMVDFFSKETYFNCVGDWVVEATMRKKPK